MLFRTFFDGGDTSTKLSHYFRRIFQSHFQGNTTKSYPMMELESDLLIKLLFIAGIVFLLWVGQAVLTRFVNQRKILKYILPYSLGHIQVQYN